MVLAHDLGRQDRRGRRQRVHGRVDAERRHLTGQLGGGIEVREGRERRRVGVVVGGHVHGLQRRDRAATGGGDSLLELAHLVGERRLVPHGRRHATEERRHLGPGLHEAEDVVDEQQHVLVLDVAEVLRHRQRRQRDAQAHARRLVHLAEHEGGLLEHARLHHLQTEVGALTGALADAGEHRHTTVLRRNTVDHLGDEHGLAHAGTAEQADLAACDVRRQQVDDLDAGLEHASRRFERIEGGGVTVDLPPLHVLEAFGGLVEGFAPDVPDVAEHLLAHRHGDAVAGVAYRGAAHQTVGRLEADRADPAVAELLGDLGEDGDGLAFEFDVELDRIVQLGQRAAGEFDVDHGAGDADDAAVLEVGSRGGFGHGHDCCSPGVACALRGWRRSRPGAVVRRPRRRDRSRACRRRRSRVPRHHRRSP